MTQQQQPTPAATASDPDEVAKVHRIMYDQGVAMVTTVDSGTPGRLVSRPLTTQRAEEDGDVLFLVQAALPHLRAQGDRVPEHRSGDQQRTGYHQPGPRRQHPRACHRVAS